jgi:hypothetical protein
MKLLWLFKILFCREAGGPPSASAVEAKARRALDEGIFLKSAICHR